MPRTFGYIRVSSDDQNPARQKEALGNTCEQFFVDFASGKNTDRPELKRLLSEVRYGDTILCHSLDRLGRSLSDLLRLVEDLTQRGITLHFMKEGLRFEGGENVSSTSKLMLMLVGAFAEFERNIIKERQREGIELAKARGVFKGGVRQISEEKVEHMNHLVYEGVPIAKAARLVGISRASAYRYLQVKK